MSFITELVSFLSPSLSMSDIYFFASTLPPPLLVNFKNVPGKGKMEELTSNSGPPTLNVYSEKISSTSDSKRLSSVWRTNYNHLIFQETITGTDQTTCIRHFLPKIISRTIIGLSTKLVIFCHGGRWWKNWWIRRERCLMSTSTSFASGGCVFTAFSAPWTLEGPSVTFSQKSSHLSK